MADLEKSAEGLSAVTVIEAAHSLGKRVSLSIVGAGTPEYEAELKDQAAEGPADIELKGKVDHTLLPALYREHDIFVFPSIWPEPFGLTHLEAMASGLPVVSTAGGGQGEFLEDGVNSLVFKEEDAAGLANCLTRLMADEDFCRGLALEGRRVAVELFSVERYVTDLEAWLEEIAGGGK